MSHRLKRVVQAFEDIADLMQISGTEPHKSYAYRTAARNLARHFDALEGQWDEDRLQRIRGIGPALAEKAVDIAETGSCDYLDRLTDKVPFSVLQLLQIPGLGIKTASAIYQTLGVSSLSELQQAADSGKLQEIEGIGPRRQQQISQSAGALASAGRFMTLDTADSHSEYFGGLLGQVEGALRVHPVGKLRRRSEQISELKLLAVLDRSAEPDEWLSRALEAVKKDESVHSVRGGEGGGCPPYMRFSLRRGMSVYVHAVPVQGEGAALLWLTGNEEHRSKLTRLAKDEKPDALSGWREQLCGMDEAEIYDRFGLQFIPPQLRCGTDEVKAARRGLIPSLLRLDDLRGDLHCHTSWSDGAASIEKMVAAARRRGMDYLAITDHSPSLTVAGGLHEDKLRQQYQHIRRLAEELTDFCLFSGVEVDILPDGSLDYPDDVLEQLDVVIASIHSDLYAGEGKLTKRLLSACEHPQVDIIGHPTGRLLGVRDPEPPDLERLLSACKRTGTAVEINSSPDRLDLPWQWVKKAAKMGVKLVISSDAHSPSGFDLLSYGVDCASRGWCEPENILNTKKASDLMDLLKDSEKEE